MTTIRRGLVVLAAAFALATSTLGLTPAFATYSDSASLTVTYSTGSVAAPTDVVGSLTCAKSTSTMGLTWTKSTTPQITGYLVTVYFSDGYTQTVQMASTATSWSASIDTYNVTAYSVKYSVTTQTSYSWTKESATVGPYQC